MMARSSITANVMQLTEGGPHNRQLSARFWLGVVSGCRHYQDKTSGRSYKTHNKQNGREPKFWTSN